MSEPGTYRESDRTPVDFSRALAAWIVAARPALLQTAGTYRATISYKDLAEEVQVVSGVRTKMLPWHWIGRVLGGVSRECHQRGEPLLSALCVHEDGTIGEGYGKAIIENEGGPVPDYLDMHAATERLNCHRFFGAQLPADGGTPALTPQVARRRNRQKVQTGVQNNRPVCPTCYLMLPVSGQCDTCS